MNGAIPPLPTTLSWRGAELSTETTLPLPYLYIGRKRINGYEK
jgi:hypothetical protein